MSNKLFPSLGSGTPVKASKTSRQNMDNVFNALLNLTSYNAHPHNLQFQSLITIVYNRIQVLYNEDPSQCIKYLKLLRKWFIEYLRGLKGDNPGLRAWHWDNVNRVPIMLADLIDFFDKTVITDSDVKNLFWRVTVALLSLDRVISQPGSPVYSTITSKGVDIDLNHELVPKDFNTLLSPLGFSISDFRKRFDYECSVFEYELLSSAGVNGDATWTAHSDAKAWLMNQDLLQSFHQYAKASKLEYIFNDLLGTVKVRDLDKVDPRDLKLGRLHSFDELGGKVRTVAIVDYWTQMLLTPLHKTINHFLKQTDLDGTFDQVKMAEAVKGWTGNSKHELYSFDLTAATDRLPVSVQEHILSHLLGDKDIAASWRKILVMRDYHTDSGDKLRYAVGQPMGARSSFAMLALTHHLIVQHAAVLSNAKGYKRYRVLGDDMTLIDTNIAGRYQDIMAYLGVPINVSKSVVHSSGLRPAAEICKRIFISGVELTTIPVKLIAKTVRDGNLAPILQSEFSSKGWTFDEDSFIGFFYSLVNEAAFKELAIMNVLPGDVSSLHSRVNLSNMASSDLKSWYPGFVDFKESNIVDVFTWTAAVESLKRLDALIRNSLAISVAVSEKFSLYSESPVDVKTLWEILGIPTEVPSSVVASLIKDIEHLEACHPIIKATEVEIKRITEIMAGLISHNTEMYNKARHGLLDMVRNALTDVWTDTDTAKAAGIRTLTNKALTNLNSMILKGTVLGTDNVATEYNKKTMTLDYNLVLNTIGRQWSIKVGIDYGVTINSVKSKVNMSGKTVLDTGRKVLQSLHLGIKPMAPN